MVSDQYNLPYQTKKTLEEFDPERNCQNMGLLLDKYMPKSVFMAGKGEWMSSILKPGINSKDANNHINPDFARHVYQRWEKMIQSLGITPFNLEVDWRMVIGLGGETVLETDLTLHHLYGMPFIPGSVLKGLTRAYVAEEKSAYFMPDAQPTGKLHASKSVDTDHPEIKRIFGEQERAGTVCFYDAMPVNCQAQYEVDIMNPHFPDYYKSQQSNTIKAPANDQPPIPVAFLTVTRTAFAFALAPRKANYANDVPLVKTWLQEALQEYGLGGKTSAGYGYFKLAEAYTRPAKLEQFQPGREIRGIVLDEKIDKVAAKYVNSGQASKCLQVLPFSSEDVVILIPPNFEEARKWKSKNWSVCLFIEERVEDNRTLLFCEPKKRGK